MHAGEAFAKATYSVGAFLPTAPVEPPDTAARRADRMERIYLFDKAGTESLFEFLKDKPHLASIPKYIKMTYQVRCTLFRRTILMIWPAETSIVGIPFHFAGPR